MRGLALAALVGVLASGPAGGGSPQETTPRPTISVETNLVMLPVTVLDGRGQFVPGLTQEQFTVYDNEQPQPIQAFSNEDVPATVGLLIDCSSSMRTRRMDVTAAATAFAESAHPLDELFSVNFNEAVWPGLPGGVVFAENVEQLHRSLARAPANGMTALYDAVDRGLDYLQLGSRERRALILVSDGGDNASTRTLASVLEVAQRTNATIYAVAIADENSHDARPDVLRRLARLTGGAVYSPKGVRGVMDAFARIGRDLRSGYMLGLSPADANGGFRTIRVVADAGDGRKLTARTRAGYYAAGHAHGTK